MVSYLILHSLLDLEPPKGRDLAEYHKMHSITYLLTFYPIKTEDRVHQTFTRSISTKGTLKNV